MSFTKEAYKKLNQNKEGVRFIRPIGEYTLNEIIEALTELEALKRYPTSEEVCEALKDFFKNSKYHNYIDTVYYSEKGKYFYTEDENRNLVEMIFDNYYIHEISPHLVTLIGRFYEGLK